MAAWRRAHASDDGCRLWRLNPFLGWETLGSFGLDCLFPDGFSEAARVQRQMKETLTITHHVQKPEYHWEISIENEPVVLLKADAIQKALQAIGIASTDERVGQILELPNGQSRAVEVDLTPELRQKLHSMSVK